MKYLTMKETCDILNITRPTLQKLIDKKIIKAMNIGVGSSNIYRIDPEDIRQLTKYRNDK